MPSGRAAVECAPWSVSSPAQTTALPSGRRRHSSGPSALLRLQEMLLRLHNAPLRPQETLLRPQRAPQAAGDSPQARDAPLRPQEMLLRPQRAPPAAGDAPQAPQRASQVSRRPPQPAHVLAVPLEAGWGPEPGELALRFPEGVAMKSPTATRPCCLRRLRPRGS